ncbi:CDK-activating kinase assembly factor [Sporormia fimetaria CBS 119925]|uniref:RNA polymerase II transcription factor B subunit 3 n=1 Tax=Sporormia fimetaria CBS 119925 TaxID=1340428 RepID=A0A6A6V6G8_9PLEO|nr:CDK-activating kinase assembly factor [Sporormia fimetaria CBS 119925]
MSKPAARGPSNANSKDGEICPVCKSSRYLNKHMKFLINPECYHKMCESCVDRIFSHGPAPCPIAGCKRTLRKVKFREQRFEDLKVEREVDIRRRVAAVFDKTEDDFETLRDYNDYLETVEEITWNLILKIDVEATEKKLRQYEAAQKAERNIQAQTYQPDPSLPSDTAQVVLKKSAAQRRAQGNPTGNTPDPASGAGNGQQTEPGLRFKGLKKYVPPPPEAPFDPFDGWAIEPQYYVTQNDYDVEWLTRAINDPLHIGGGYDMRDFYSWALCDAFSGFGVFVEDGKDVEMADVF